jgi:Metal-dependent hydrolase
MKILSLNCWGGMLHAPLLAYLPAVDADVYFLQEVPRALEPQPESLTYREGEKTLDQRTELYREVVALLPRHDGWFLPAASGPLYDGARAYRSEFGLATFLRTSFSVIGEAAGFVHGTYSPDGWGEHPRARNAHCLRVYDHEAGRPVTLAQIHGLRDPAGKGDTPARADQARRLIALIDSVRASGDPLVVCGDFNLLPDSATFAMLREAFGLVDLVTSHGFTDTRTSFYEKPGRYADYVLVTPDVTVRSFDVVETPEISDHRALLLDIG